MTGNTIIVNGGLSAPEAAAFTLDNVDVTYGYGCYETLKVRAGTLYFPEFHEERFLRSAAILGIRHAINEGDVVKALRALVVANEPRDCNIKLMMIGHDDRPADWYAFELPPVLPPASAYELGVAALLFRGERHFPRAKSLSMLLSTVAYRAATAAGCYDALLVNGRGEITEGTRTNVFYARRGESGVVYTPPAADVLEGVTRRTVLAALAGEGWRTVERPLLASEALDGEFALAVTSTSSRVIPVRSLVGLPVRGEPVTGGGIVALGSPSDAARLTSVEVGLAPEMERLRRMYDAWLKRYADSEGDLRDVRNTPAR
ncbi:MAG: aminotransferase class IV [Spirochaetales bacterium]|nr:aminotransferase class IV [Spirochaetales bacterium]